MNRSCRIILGGSAWTAKNQDLAQYLTIDLGETKNVTAIATQGRNSPKEYVIEYGISYGSNGLDYVDYREIDGSTKVFPPPPTMQIRHRHSNISHLTNLQSFPPFKK